MDTSKAARIRGARVSPSAIDARGFRETRDGFNSLRNASIVVAGAGIVGLWQALMLARAGHRVRLVEKSAVPFANAASRWAGAMIAPECEAESAPSVVRDLGRRGLALWQSV